MTNERKQRILCLITDANGEYYYNGPLDGIWGPESKKAAERFLKDFGGAEGAGAADNNAGDNSAEDNNVPSKTGTFWDEIEYFDREEFRCKCGGKYCQGFPAEPDVKMVRYADEIRRRLGKPLGVNSGLRCSQHNANCGGAKSSQHLLGTACDLGKPAGVTVEKMAEVAEAVIGSTGGIGLYSWGIHIDSRAVKARWDERG